MFLQDALHEDLRIDHQGLSLRGSEDIDFFRDAVYSEAMFEKGEVELDY